MSKWWSKVHSYIQFYQSHGLETVLSEMESYQLPNKVKKLLRMHKIRDQVNAGGPKVLSGVRPPPPP